MTDTNVAAGTGEGKPLSKLAFRMPELLRKGG
jgi:hypothetical protein